MDCIEGAVWRNLGISYWDDCPIPCNGKMCPTVIDKSRPIGSVISRLRDQIYEVTELVDFNIQLLYTFNLWSFLSVKNSLNIARGSFILRSGGRFGCHSRQNSRYAGAQSRATATAAGGFLLLSESVELNIGSMEQNLYH
jgi:hypothetical protein